jgi:PPM family protein phosphatase
VRRPGYEIAIRLTAAGATCEDYAAFRDLGSCVVVAIADGAGGTGGGAQAAELAVEAALASAGTIDPLDELAWCAVLAELDGRLEAHPTAGETTLVVAALGNRQLAGASIGDSQAWLVASSALDLTVHQRRKPLLGSGRAHPTGFRTCGSFDTLMLATDGLLNYAPRDAVLNKLREKDPTRAADELLELVRLPSGALHDDVGVLLVGMLVF